MDPQTGAYASDTIRRAQLAHSPIGFALANPAGDGGPVVFISPDARWSELTLTIKNNTDDPVMLDTTSLLQFYLSPLLTNAEIGRIRIATSTSGWSITTAPDERGNSYIALRPTQRRPTPLPPTATLDIKLNGVLASGSPRSSHFRVAYSGFGHMQPGAQRIPVMLHLPADTKATDWPLDLRFGPREEYGDRDSAIYVTPWAVTPEKPAILNTFVLQITARLALPFQGAQPSIIVSFLGGDTDASLCADSDLVAMTAVIDQSPGDPWTVTKDTIADLPMFKVTGQPGTTSMDGLLAIRFNNLATKLASGKSSCALIQFTGMPGYNDGFAVAILDKVAPVPYVRSFAAYQGDSRDPMPQDATVDYGPITLKWDVFAAENCLLLGHKDLLKPVDTFPVKPDTPSYTFTLQPQIGNHGWAQTAVEFSVTPPVVNPLGVAPDWAYPNDFVAVTWNCSNGDHCSIADDKGLANLDRKPLSGSASMQVGSTDTTFTLTCFGAPKTSVTHKVQIYPQVACSISVTLVGDPETVLTARMAPPDFEVPTYMPETWVTVNWSTQHARSCSVICVDDGRVVSTALQGSFSEAAVLVKTYYAAPNAIRDMHSWIFIRRRYKISAVGNGVAEATAEYAPPFGYTLPPPLYAGVPVVQGLRTYSMGFGL